MSIASFAVEKRTVTVFTTIVLLVGGMASYKGLGKLEDPEFTVKTAVVTTTYPGATADEVELEVTDRIEIAIQEMPQVKEISSFSRAGFSLISVDIIAAFGSDELPQIWDELRKKVRDVRASLPPGAGQPVVTDDFGDVYGFLMAVVGDGFTHAELERYVDSIKKELSVVDGVARVELWGVQPEAVYLEVSQARIAALGLAPADVLGELTQQNTVVDAGSVDIQDERFRIELTGEFQSPEEIGDLVVRGGYMLRRGKEAQRLLRIRDFATVTRGYVEPTNWEMRYNGEPAIGVSIANKPGENIINLGARLDRRLHELKAVLPVGIETHKISWQADLVAESINAFMISLMQAVAIVLIVLWVAMGLRTAFIVGMTGLAFTIVASFLFMKLGGIDLQRMSLGALIIAMGMMVDNAIVVSDGILVRIQQGMDRVKAAVEAATQPSWPLLGATFVAVAAFYPIAASEESAGEYCETLFSVVAIALMLSWVLSVTITPVMCIALLPAPKKAGQADIYGGRMYRGFRALLAAAFRVAHVPGLPRAAGGGIPRAVARPGRDGCVAGRGRLRVPLGAPDVLPRFGPAATHGRLLGPGGLLEDERVSAVSTFIGQGPPRFYLPVDPESPYPSYGQIIVNVHDYRDVDDLIAELRPTTKASMPQARVVLRKYGLGPSETWPVEARISGPAVADPEVLRELGERGEQIVAASPHADIVRTNWRQRVKKVIADYDETNARWTRTARQDVARATQRGYDGMVVGQYREEDKLLPIIVRAVEPERREFAGSMGTLQVRPLDFTQSVPLSQLTRSIDVEWEDPLIWRWDRRRAVTVEAVPTGLATVLRADVIDAIESVPLPPGYELEWDGEYSSSRDAQQSLIPGMIPAGIVIALVIVALFNAYRPPLIILFTIPFALIGVTVGLLATRQPFGFVALLGAMSLAGMMIKNAIVLLDQASLEKAAGKSDYDAIMDAAVSRLRPVLLAAGTTVLGVIPLLKDVFWISLAVTIMAGLAFGTILTMILLPVLYAILYRVKSPSRAQTSSAKPEPASR
ncbi:MAG: efflux RND transporter permease subunit [Planctomycetota bacterium]